MNPINLYNDNDIDLKKYLIRVGDLINLDGPLLSLFIDYRNNDLYIFDWIDSIDEANRWLVYKVDAQHLNLYTLRKISYKQFFNKAITETNNFYHADIVNSKESEYLFNKISVIPSEYFPTEDIYFEKNDAKNYTQIAITINKNIFPDKLESPLNKLEIKEYYKNSKPLPFLNQNFIITFKYSSENQNTLLHNFSRKLVPQQNARENNRLLAKERMDVHPW